LVDELSTIEHGRLSPTGEKETLEDDYQLKKIAEDRIRIIRFVAGGICLL
jgi:hypothetical protein